MRTFGIKSRNSTGFSGAAPACPGLRPHPIRPLTAGGPPLPEPPRGLNLPPACAYLWDNHR